MQTDPGFTQVQEVAEISGQFEAVTGIDRILNLLPDRGNLFRTEGSRIGKMTLVPLRLSPEELAGLAQTARYLTLHGRSALKHNEEEILAGIGNLNVDLKIDRESCRYLLQLYKKSLRR